MSCINYFILGGIVQKITGADVGVFITDNINRNVPVAVEIGR